VRSHGEARFNNVKTLPKKSLFASNSKKKNLLEEKDDRVELGESQSKPERKTISSKTDRK
jgi:hypothetical protein